MGFRKDAFATIWSVEDKGKYANVRISISKKDKETGEYKDDFSGFVRFVGKAYELSKDLAERDRIQILSCDVTRNYNKENGKSYTNFAVFEAEKQEPREVVA